MPEKFIGSLLSLISKSEIRYEGILYTINTEEASIALTDVKSFGTEDRPVEKPLGPRSERYEYIIFRASDIKSLEVIKQAGEVEFEDPAIIKARTNYLPTKPIDPSGLTFGSSAETNVPLQTDSMSCAFSRIGQAPDASVRPPSIQLGQGTATGPPAAGPAFGSATADFRSNNSTPTLWTRRSPASDVGVQTPPVDKQQKEKTVQQKLADQMGVRIGGPSNAPQLQQQPVQQRQQHRQAQHGQQNHSGDYHQRGYDNRRSGPRVQHRDQSNRSNQTQGAPMNQRPMMPMQYRGGRQGPPPPPHHKRGPVFNRMPLQPQRSQQFHRSNNRKPQLEATAIKISDDYDFEKANKEFEELESKLQKAKISDDDESKVKENGNVSGDAEQEESTSKNEEPFYDKEKSFFDKISCEALERSKGKVNRIDWRKERKINVETFGTSANYRRGFGNRGYNYGGNYRQNYNNRRGGGVRNYGERNRNHNDSSVNGRKKEVAGDNGMD